MGKGASAEQVVREIQRRTRRRFSAEEKVRIVLEGLRGEAGSLGIVPTKSRRAPGGWFGNHRPPRTACERTSPCGSG